MVKRVYVRKIYIIKKELKKTEEIKRERGNIHNSRTIV